jgi:hypothetical protein
LPLCFKSCASVPGQTPDNDRFSLTALNRRCASPTSRAPRPREGNRRPRAKSSARCGGTLRRIRRRISTRVPGCEPGSALRCSCGRPSRRRFSGAEGALKTQLRPRIRAISSNESNAPGGGDRRGPRRPTRPARIIPDRIGFQPAGRSSSREGTPLPAPRGSGRRASSRAGRNVRNRYLGVLVAASIRIESHWQGHAWLSVAGFR